ncbi:RNA-directed DNA polymerase, eukaryota, reverse transcriptase zinc-binding domain protein [Tanacetum coccineum]
MGGQTRPRNYQYLGSPQKCLYLKETISGMRLTQALTAIQTMADHSQKWHDRTTSKSIRSSSSNDGLAALVNKLDNLGRDMKKLKESVYAIQFKGTSDDEDNIEEIIGYLGPTSYDGFVDLDEEEYNKRRCRIQQLRGNYRAAPTPLGQNYTPATDDFDNGGDGLRLWLPDGEGRRRVEESGVVDRVHRVVGSLFGLAGKTRRKSFPAAASGGRRRGSGGRIIGEEEEFSNVVTTFPRFKEIVLDGWSSTFYCRGFHMFTVVKKLKFLKKPLRKLLYDKGNLHENVNRLRVEVERVQKDLDADPFNQILRDEEACYVRAFTDALIMEEHFLKQKAKVEWLHVGDSNSAYFHKEGVPSAFVSHYEAFLGQSDVHMHNYHLDRGSPRCAFKVDIQKAYDTVDWDFLKQVLLAFGFHDRMILWIMECVTTISFSISINGTLHGYFKGKRGLRQGDPMSPYLFTLVMEVFTLMLKRKVRDSHDFIYHRYCADLELINLCFADDLFIFAHGDPSSAKVIMEAMEEFKNASGLVPSFPKSTAYFCNVLNHTKLAILQILPFEEGRLSKNKSLSAAGRLQLVRSVVSSMHVYWASVFILPSQIILDIEQLMRGFLWCHGDMSKGKAKVSWEVVCLPKNEGGLGVRRLDTFNKALMVPHIWNLLARKDSLWVKWIHVYKLRGRHFFDIPYRGCMTWGWRKLLQLRPLIRDYLWFRIGTGNTCSLWFDKWSSMQPLANIISCRDIHRAGFSLCSKVNDAIRDGAWVWPEEWLSKYPSLISVAAPMLSNEVDQLEWHNSMGVVKHFSVREVWETIRPRSDVVDWYHVVWFPNCIPSHAFHLWLIAKRRLKTQDRLRPWDSRGGSLPTCCPLCDGPPDSHDHLFFIVPTRHRFGTRRTIRSVIAKLVVAATSYYIWQERNSRLFANKKRSHGQLTECIKSTVRLKLLSCMFKKSKDALFFKHLWDLPNSSFR